MPVRVANRGTRRLALVLLGLAWLAFVFPVFGGKVHFPTDFGYPYFKAPAHVATPSNPADTDSFHAVYPYHVYLGQQLRAGHLPLWDPTRFLGVPYAADISMGTFYPPNWLFAAGHVEVVGTLIWAASLLASLLLAYWFLRVLTLHPLASAAGAIVWTFSGFMSNWSTGDPLLGAAIWLPLALGGLEVALRGRPRKGILLAGLGLGLSVLAGHGQISYYVWVAAGLWALVSIAAAALGARRSGSHAAAQVVARGAAVTAGAFLVGAGLASVQLLGTLEYSHLILRQKEAYVVVLANRVHAGFLATSLIPDYFGNPVDHNFRYVAFLYTSDVFYAGVFAIPLAVGGAFHRNRRASLFFGLLVATGLGAAFGTPLLHLIFGTVPGLARFGAPSRILILADVGLAGLAALGLDAILARQRWAAGATLVTSGLVLAALGVMAATRLGTPVAAAYVTGRGIRAIVLVAAAAGLVFCLQRFPRQAAAVAAALVVVVGMDLWLFGFRYHPFQNDEPVLTSDPPLEYLAAVPGPRPRYAQASTFVLSPNASMVFGLYSVDGYDPLIPGTFSELLGLVGSELPFLAHGNAVFPIPDSPTEPAALDLLGVRSLTSPSGDAVPGTLAHTGGYSVYDEPQAFPPAFLATCWSTASDAGALARMQAMSATALRSTVVLAPGAGHLGTPPATCDPGPDATINRYEAQDVSVSVAPSNPGGLLVLSDQWYPGWTATVDGKPAAILRGDVALRAVALSPGAHRIRFRYQPRWPLNGLAVFALTVAVAAVLALGRRPNYHSDPDHEHLDPNK
jgi:hypothetical protein